MYFIFFTEYQIDLKEFGLQGASFLQECNEMLGTLKSYLVVWISRVQGTVENVKHKVGLHRKSNQVLQIFVQSP
jgi:hypothetical protein